MQEHATRTNQNELATRPPRVEYPLCESRSVRDAIDAGQIKPEQAALLALTRIPAKATLADVAAFAEICRDSGLKPQRKQIYLLPLGSGVATVVGIDGYRSIAHRAGCDGIDEPEYRYDSEGQLLSATVRVRRKGCAAPFVATAMLDEYNAGTPIWRKMPHAMLAKCAEALALRKAFPDDLAGSYGEEELDQARERDEPTALRVVKPVAPAISQEPARTQQTVPTPPTRDAAKEAAPADEVQLGRAPALTPAPAPAQAQPQKRLTPWEFIIREFMRLQGRAKQAVGSLDNLAWHVARLAKLNPGDGQEREETKQMLNEVSEQQRERVKVAVERLISAASEGIKPDEVEIRDDEPPAHGGAAQREPRG